MAKSSINFKKATSHSDAHNFRDDEPEYLLPKEHRKNNEYWKHTKSEKEIFSESVAQQKTGRKPKLENSRWEAVLNLNEHHSLDDVKKVAKHIEEKFNITCTALSVHRDEGRVERDTPIYNYHAHLNFITHKDGKQNWRKEFIKPDSLRELQTEVAKLLKMERGVDKRISKKERLEHRQHKYAERQKEQTLAKIKDVQEENKRLRQKLKEAGASREQYAELEAEIRRLKEEARAKDLTIENMQREIEGLEWAIQGYEDREEEAKSVQNELKDDLERAEVALEQKDAQIADLHKENKGLKWAVEHFEEKAEKAEKALQFVTEHQPAPEEQEQYDKEKLETIEETVCGDRQNRTINDILDKLFELSTKVMKNMFKIEREKLETIERNEARAQSRNMMRR